MKATTVCGMSEFTMSPITSKPYERHMFVIMIFVLIFVYKLLMKKLLGKLTNSSASLSWMPLNGMSFSASGVHIVALIVPVPSSMTIVRRDLSFV